MILHPLNTEKGMRMLQENNTLVFAVDRRIGKPEIKTLLEKQFSIKIKNIRTMTNLQGKKKAFVTLDPSTPAIDLATKLGMM